MQVTSKAGATKLRAPLNELMEAGMTQLSFAPTTSGFVERYEQSEGGQERHRSVEAVLNARDNGAARRSAWRQNETRAYYTTWVTSFRLLLQREVALTLRDRSYIAARLAQDVFVGLLTGAFFLRVSVCLPVGRTGFVACFRFRYACLPACGQPGPLVRCWFRVTRVG